VCQIKFGEAIVVGIGLTTKLNQEGREQSTADLLLVFPEVTIEEGKGCQS